LEKGMDGYIVAYCPALKGCVTQGRSEDEAFKNLKEAIELYLEADPQDIDRPSDEYKVCEMAI
ncbi:MAG: type II toxin-antitoxin system HicB family antitoxin, partial [Thermodesulfobacteriota bacterium]|nr:type II toxin-antitoxin system HicB family antitoxin [Thermodesulfobacteriota bacterium]